MYFQSSHIFTHLLIIVTFTMGSCETSVKSFQSIFKEMNNIDEWNESQKNKICDQLHTITQLSATVEKQKRSMLQIQAEYEKVSMQLHEEMKKHKNFSNKYECTRKLAEGFKSQITKLVEEIKVCKDYKTLIDEKNNEKVYSIKLLENKYTILLNKFTKFKDDKEKSEIKLLQSKQDNDLLYKIELEKLQNLRHKLEETVEVQCSTIESLEFQLKAEQYSLTEKLLLEENLNAENKSLLKKLNDLITDRNTLTVKNENFSNIINLLKKDVGNLNDDIQTKNEELRVFSNKEKKFKLLLESSSKKSNVLQENVECLNSEINSLVEQIKIVSAESSEISCLLTEKCKELNIIKKRSSLLQSDKTALEKVLNQTKQDLLNSNDDSKKNQQKVLSKQVEVDKVKSDLTKLEKSLNKVIASLKIDINSKEQLYVKETSTLKNEAKVKETELLKIIDNLKLDITEKVKEALKSEEEHKKVINQKCNKINEIEKNNDQLREKVSKLEKFVTKCENQTKVINMNECSLNEIKLKLNDKDKVLKSVDNEIKALKNENDTKEKEIKSLQLEINNLKTNKSDLDQNLAQLDKDFKLKENKLESLQKQSKEELDSKETELKNIKEKYEEQLNSLNKELTNLKSSNEELQVNLTSANENVKTSTNLLEKKEKALKISTDLLQKCQDEIEKKTSELDTNKKSLTDLEENYSKEKETKEKVVEETKKMETKIENFIIKEKELQDKIKLLEEKSKQKPNIYQYPSALPKENKVRSKRVTQAKNKSTPSKKNPLVDTSCDINSSFFDEISNDEPTKVSTPKRTNKRKLAPKTPGSCKLYTSWKKKKDTATPAKKKNPVKKIDLFAEDSDWFD